jgi:ATP-dependent Clp protease adaptor protein ClpS
MDNIMTTDIVVDKKSVTKERLKEPSKYKVIVCNDDVTSVEFVIAMLITVFKHDEKSAMNLTISIHNKGSAVVGIYSHEVAEQKSVDGTTMARLNNYPLIIKVEPE